MNSIRLLLAVTAVGFSLVAVPQVSAQLTLREAFVEANAANYSNRIAASNSATQTALSIAPLKGILPNVHLEAGYVRTTDPIGAFGSTLRQRTITQANFDPNRLNYPDAVANYQTAIVFDQPLINVDAWVGRKTALHGANASRAVEQWTRLSTSVDVVRAYYGAVFAQERVVALEIASAAALRHVTEANALVQQGLATRSDALLADVRQGDIDAQLVEAQGGASNALRQLAVVLGRNAANRTNDLLALPHLPSTERIRAEVAGDTAERTAMERGDVRAANDALSAARDDGLRAKTSLLPRVNAFARYDWNSPTSLHSNDRNWTVGVMASWSPFAGAGEVADIEAARSRSQVALAQAEATSANARLDIEQSRTALCVALLRMDIAERAFAQSAEAHRIIGRKYVGGLAGVVELLDAQALETHSALAVSQARFTAIVAAAERRRALGLDPATLALLDDSTTVAAYNAPTGR